jgi:anaerobic ribonucleoside-triphosphate reductase
MVENELMNEKAFTVAHNYITYRYERALVRKANTTDQKILSLLGRNNEEVKQENSNKNPTVNSTQRDYMAGEVSKDITKRFLLPQDIWDAHEKGNHPLP